MPFGTSTFNYFFFFIFIQTFNLYAVNINALVEALWLIQGNSLSTAEQILAAADIAGHETPSSTAVNGEPSYSTVKERERLPALCKSVTGTKKIDMFSFQQKVQILTSPAFCSWCTAPHVYPSFHCTDGRTGNACEAQSKVSAEQMHSPLVPSVCWEEHDEGRTQRGGRSADSALLTSCTSTGSRSVTGAGLCFPRLSTELSTFGNVNTFLWQNSEFKGSVSMVAVMIPSFLNLLPKPHKFHSAAQSARKEKACPGEGTHLQHRDRTCTASTAMAS